MTINGGTVTAKGTRFGIHSLKRDVIITDGTVEGIGNGTEACGIQASKNVIIKGGTITGIGTVKGISGTVKNEINGTGWTNTTGTEGKTTIPASQDGQNLTYLMVQFPEAKDPAKVTKEPKANELTYTGSAQKLVTEGEASGGTLQYALGENENTAPEEGWTDSVPDGIEAKTYYVWYKAKGDDNHSDSKPECIPVTIAKAEKFTVTFDVQGHGKELDSQTVEKDSKVTRPTDPTAEGYTFGGWFKEKECTNEWNFDSDKVTSNITLYAKWTENDKPEPTPTDTGVKLNVSEITIAQGRENALKATTVPEGASITWTSSDNSVAYVDAAGVVTGLNVGTATITAKITVDGKEYTASCKVTVVPTGSPIIFPTGGGEHTHKYVWDTIEATEDMDGELRYQCETCGDIKERVPLTAYNVFNKNATEKIRNAKKDATVKIETNKWISFHKMVMEALAERPDVTLEISFLDEGHKGNRFTVTISKGTVTMSLVDKNGFTGFLYLGGKFGLKTQ